MKEVTIKSDGRAGYVEFLIPRPSALGVIAIGMDLANDSVIHLYKNDDSTCDFYSEREKGRKKYWHKDIPTEKYSQDDSDDQELAYYSEIEGVTQEWYYSFSTFEGMAQFVDTHKPINLSQAIQTKMKDNLKCTRPSSILNLDHNYGASVEVAANGDKTTSVYLVLTEIEQSFL